MSTHLQVKIGMTEAVTMQLDEVIAKLTYPDGTQVSGQAWVKSTAAPPAPVPPANGTMPALGIYLISY